MGDVTGTTRFVRRNAFSASFLLPVLVPTGVVVASPLIKPPRINVVGKPLAKRRGAKIPTWQLLGGLIEQTVQGKFKTARLAIDRRHIRGGTTQFLAQRKGLTSLPPGIVRPARIQVSFLANDRRHRGVGDVIVPLVPKKLLFTPPSGINRLGKVTAYTLPSQLSGRRHKEWLGFSRFVLPKDVLVPPPPLVHKAQVFSVPGSQFRLIDQTSRASVRRTSETRRWHSGRVTWLTGRTSIPVILSLPGAVCTIILPTAIGNKAKISIVGNVCTIAVGEAT